MFLSAITMAGIELPAPVGSSFALFLFVILKIVFNYCS
jgi:hypothetical protein